MPNQEPLKPFLRWAGSKKKLLPKLREYWSGDFQRYVEPFMGSASLFFSLLPPKALLSDINAELIETFSVVKSNPAEVYESLRSYRKGKTEYYRVRAQKPARLTEIRRAARFIYLNRFCFNGIYRTNLDGQFNVPYAPTGTGPLPTLEQLVAAGGLLRRCEIRCGDFESVLTSKVKKGDFVYLDPPFAITNRRIFRQYGPKIFVPSDVTRLSAVLKEIDRRGATFLLSYAFNQDVVSKLKEWEIRRVVTQRNVSGFAKHRRKAVEVLVSNYAHPDGL